LETAGENLLSGKLRPLQDYGFAHICKIKLEVRQRHQRTSLIYQAWQVLEQKILRSGFELEIPL